MKYSLKKLNLVGSIILATCTSVFAAQISIIAPQSALANRLPIKVLVLLDVENDVVSGLAGDFSFPSEMFTVSDIQTEGSVISLWAVEPHISKEKYFDNRTHIVFEGIAPGGYDGVRSAYYDGKKNGVVFTATLIPKKKGEGSLIVDDIHVNRFDSQATPIPTASAIRLISVPELLPEPTFSHNILQRVENKEINAFVTRDPLINNNAWYLIIDEQNKKSSTERILIAESSLYDATLVSEIYWKESKSPYVLLNQDRTKFIHIKIIYANSTYTTVTLLPVENSKGIFSLSRILVSIVVIVSLLYFYGITFFTYLKKRK